MHPDKACSCFPGSRVGTAAGSQVGLGGLGCNWDKTGALQWAAVLHLLCVEFWDPRAL